MKTAVLRRTEMGDAGTFGTLEIMGEVFATGELPERGNQHNISSIPAGVYECRWTHSPKFGHYTYEIIDVLDREHVRFHIGNWSGDVTKGLRSNVDGCILLGMACDYLNGQRAVISSGIAIRRFEEIGAQEDLMLTIINEYLEAGELPATV